MTHYSIPTGHAQHELVEKRSRFIAQVWPVQSEQEARAHIDQVKRQYHDARHNCWCYGLRAGAVRYSDDGEPQGTAGQPMLNVFQRQGVENFCCVVTRYFGGILLGAGGLARVYGQSAKHALDAAGISVVRQWAEMLVVCSYAQLERVRQESAAWGGVVIGVQYDAAVELTLLLPEEQAAGFQTALKELTAGSAETLVTGRQMRAVPQGAENGE